MRLESKKIHLAAALLLLAPSAMAAGNLSEPARNRLSAHVRKHIGEAVSKGGFDISLYQTDLKYGVSSEKLEKAYGRLCNRLGEVQGAVIVAAPLFPYLIYPLDSGEVNRLVLYSVSVAGFCSNHEESGLAAKPKDIKELIRNFEGLEAEWRSLSKKLR